MYVPPFPPGPGKFKVSIGGGQYPRWRRDGKELFSLAPDRKLMASVVKSASVGQVMFEAAAPQLLFETRVPAVSFGANLFPYAVSADGNRFLVSASDGEKAGEPLSVVVNWLARGEEVGLRD